MLIQCIISIKDFELTRPCHILREYSEGRFNYDLPNINANFMQARKWSGASFLHDHLNLFIFWVCYGWQLYYCFKASIIENSLILQLGGEVWAKVEPPTFNGVAGDRLLSGGEASSGIHKLRDFLIVAKEREHQVGKSLCKKARGTFWSLLYCGINLEISLSMVKLDAYRDLNMSWISNKP
jgi:hypothetical protein